MADDVSSVSPMSEQQIVCVEFVKHASVGFLSWLVECWNVAECWMLKHFKSQLPHLCIICGFLVNASDCKRMFFSEAISVAKYLLKTWFHSSTPPSLTPTEYVRKRTFAGIL